MRNEIEKVLEAMREDYKKETHSAFYALENYLCDMGAL